MCLYVTLTLHVYCLQKIVWTPDVSPISSPSVKHQPSSCGTAEPLITAEPSITAGLAATAGPCIIEEQSIAAKPPVRAVDHSANTVHSLAFSIDILQPSIGEIHRADPPPAAVIGGDECDYGGLQPSITLHCCYVSCFMFSIKWRFFLDFRLF